MSEPDGPEAPLHPPWFMLVQWQWWGLLFVFAAIGVFLHSTGDTDTAKTFFGAVLGQGATGGIKAFKAVGQPAAK